MAQGTARQRWHQEHVASWLQLIATLRSESWEAHLTCAAAPVQVEGSLPNGERFYFRARHSDVSLGIGGDDPADIPEWEESESHPEASWLPAAEGETLLRRLAFRYAQQSNPTVYQHQPRPVLRFSEGGKRGAHTEPRQF